LNIAAESGKPGTTGGRSADKHRAEKAVQKEILCLTIQGIFSNHHELASNFTGAAARDGDFIGAGRN
jgi:hypothetical protein